MSQYLTTTLAEGNMIAKDREISICTSDAQIYHMKAKSFFLDEWKNYQESAAQTIDWDIVANFLLLLEQSNVTSQESYLGAYKLAAKELKFAPSKPMLLKGLEILRKENSAIGSGFEKYILKKSVRSNSGVVVITVVTAPGEFSCPQDCHYCPNEPGQPRSYLSTEPAVTRANQNKFDPVFQFYDRAITLAKQGHHIDKIEIIVLGGTWSGYPAQYKEEFCRDLFYAANTFDESVVRQYTALGNTSISGEDYIKMCQSSKTSLRPRLPINEEQILNETAKTKIIGLTLETRPDHITKHEIRHLRMLGCTRVQIGIQHIDDKILSIINRGCYLDDCIRAVSLLKHNCYKVDIHLMPDLPGSDPEKDKEMFQYVLDTPFLQADHWKIYPCEVTPFSQIEKWYDEKSFIPYTEKNPADLVDVLVDVKSKVHPWIRLNRVIRDIPVESIIAGNANVNLRQEIYKVLKENKQCCSCIRCREVRDWPEDISISDLKLVHRNYRSSDGDEIFISYEGKGSRGLGGGSEGRGLQKPLKLSGSAKKKLKKKEKKLAKRNAKIESYHSEETADNAPLYGLLRLRFNDNKYSDEIAFPELQNCALIRELHVYGKVIPARNDTTNKNSAPDEKVQHLGIGRRLMREAEIIARSKGYTKIAVISGVGVRNYYRKLGYEIEGNGNYLIKHLPPNPLITEYGFSALFATTILVGLGKFCQLL